MASAPFTFSVDPPSTTTGTQPRNNVLCRHCKKMARESKIIHQAPKINWLEGGTNDDDLNEEATPVPQAQNQYTQGPKFEVFDHHKTLGALKRSARTCHLCALLSAYDPEYPELVDDASDRIPYVMKVLRADDHLEGPGVLKVDIGGRRSGATYLMDCKPREKPQGTLGCPRTGEYEVLGLAKQWLDTCLATHDDCNRRSRPTAETGDWILPTRLVKVTGFLRNVFSMKLCLGKDLPPDTRYLTLSHCWGGADILKLTQDSLPSFLSDIPLQDLPRNFKDAAATTLFLGYEYIWIDSLCIIQDSVEDWQREAAVMGNVYRYSICTIAAAAAKDPHVGCFVERNACAFLPCELFPDSRERSGVYAENWRNPKEPLLSRGWVVQERTLSLRTLYYGTHMVSWNCTSATASEEEQTPIYVQRPGIKRAFYDFYDKLKKDGNYDNLLDWWTLVEEYTACSLTFVSDRWAAIEGLARIIEGRSGSRLVHGLWETNLAAELLWEVKTPRHAKRLENRAPSWSWLSVDEPVGRVYGFSPKDYARMDATVSLLEDSQDDSKLVVRGHMVRLIWRTRYRGDGRREYPFRYPWGEYGHYRNTWSPDVLPDEGWETWAVQFIESIHDDRIGGLVVKREGNNSWSRVGTFTGFVWHPHKGKEETITLI